MRGTACAGLFACAAIIVASSPSVNAQAIDLLEANNIKNDNSTAVLLASVDAAPKTEALEEVDKPLVYEVDKNDSLSKIAKKHDTTWKRLFDKNEQIENPDLIMVGDKVTIPKPDEVLKDRPLPTPAPAPVQRTEARATVKAPTVKKPTVSRTPQAKPAPAPTVSRGSSTGNLYTAGYCTWYVKNKRPDLPNNLGNAYTWVARASAQGLPTGSTPRVGAVAQRNNHVVYVEAVNGDGTMVISEMNYRNLYERTVRTVNASEWRFIY